ncbi:MAG: hypothetical protein QXQ43_03680 [Nitrososphaerota archaeon]
MSANNEILAVKFKDGWRVAVYFVEGGLWEVNPKDKEVENAYLYIIFRNSPVFQTLDKAVPYIEKLTKEFTPEYGVHIVPKKYSRRSFPQMTFERARALLDYLL